MLILSDRLSGPLLLLLFWAALRAERAESAEVVFVLRSDGRWVSGEVDSQTDETYLCLRSPARSFRLISAIPWQEVAEANIGDRRLSTAKFREQIKTLQSVAPDGLLPATLPSPAATVLPGPPSWRPDVGSRVVSLAVEAWVDNWDQDAEADGIALRVLPRNAFGDIVPAAGQLLVTATGRNQLVPHDAQAFPEFGRWSVHLEQRAFLDQPAIVQLPFQATQSDVDFTLQRHALVTATLFVPGQGRYEAQTVLYLRTFNPVRDDLLRRQGLLDR